MNSKFHPTAKPILFLLLSFASFSVYGSESSDETNLGKLNMAEGTDASPKIVSATESTEQNSQPKCNSLAIASATAAIQNLEKRCKDLQKNTPSDCQRGLISQCQQNIQRIKQSQNLVCIKTAMEEKRISGLSKNTKETQKSAENSNVVLNQEAKLSGISIDKFLLSQAKGITALRNRNMATYWRPMCAKSSSFVEFAKATDSLTKEVYQYESTLYKIQAKSTGMIQKAERNSTISKRSGSGMSSMGGVDIAVPGAAKNSQSAVTVSQGALPSGLEAGGVGTSNEIKVVAPAAAPAQSGTAKPAQSENQVASYIALAKVAEQAAKIYEKKSMNDGTEGESHADFVADYSAENSPVYTGNSEALIKSLGVKTEGFNDQQKGMIAKALDLMPECSKQALVSQGGLTIRHDPSLTNSRGSCMRGKQVADGLILLRHCTDQHTFTTALVVHEMFHQVANRKNFYSKYRAGNSCPVSQYPAYILSGKLPGNFPHEDFAEAASFAVFQGIQPKNKDSCADEKINQARKIVNCQ